MDIAEYKLLSKEPWERIVDGSEFKTLTPVDGMVIGVKKQVIGSMNYHYHKYVGVICPGCGQCHWSRGTAICKTRFTGYCSECSVIFLKDAGNPNNPMYNTHYSIEARERLSRIYKNVPNLSMHKIILDSTTGKFIDTGELSDYALQLSLRNKGSNNPRYGKQSDMMRVKYQDPEYREKMRLIYQDPEFREKMRLIYQSPEFSEKMRLNFQDPEFVERYRKGLNAKPNNAELKLQSILDKYYPNTYKYVGDFQVNLGGKFPDFININGRKEVIELFGNYWHDPNEFPDRLNQEELIEHYKQYGFSCIIIWEEELKNTEGLLEHVRSGGTYKPKRWRNSKNQEVEKSIILDPTTKKFSYNEQG